jgi:hypothetical protein
VPFGITAEESWQRDSGKKGPSMRIAYLYQGFPGSPAIAKRFPTVMNGFSIK